LSDSRLRDESRYNAPTLHSQEPEVLSLQAPTIQDAAPDRIVAEQDSPRIRHPKFPRDTTGFYAELQRRVAEYFSSNGLKERDCFSMYFKTAIMLAWVSASYVLLVFFAEHWWQAVPLAFSLAFGLAAVAFNIQHDGGHSAYSDRLWVNRLAGYSLDLIGASSYLWKWKHGVLHHTYPNVDGHDTDLDAGVVARLSPWQPRFWYHRWQHLYLWPLYAITASRWHLFSDFKEVAVGAIGSHRVPRPRSWNLVAFLVGKTVSIGLLLFAPMIWHEWWLVVAMYFLVTAVVGVALTIVFQLAHCVEEADFPTPGESEKMPDAWAVHQIRTTVDFARTSRLAFWLLGGLNFQTEHHLFPRICHVHYPALSRIVEATCAEYGVKFRQHGTFAAGVRSHYRWLRRMGRTDGFLANA